MRNTADWLNLQSLISAYSLLRRSAVNGAGLGSNHQTGWNGLVAKMIQLYGLLDPKKILEEGKREAFVKGTLP